MNRFSRNKKIIFTCVLILLALLFVEAGAFTMYCIVRKRIFPRSKYESDISHISNNVNITGFADKQIRNSEMRFGNVVEVIHPYLGFVQDPKRNNNISDFGFPGDVNPINSRTKNRLIVGIFGGSFAEGTYRHGRDSLINVLKATGKEIVVVNLAMGGYKQPQQLLALTYLLSLGAKFDLVINIDGFNEVALPSSENISKNVFPIYPRGWYFRVAAASDQKAVMQIARLVALDQKREKWAGLFEKTRLYYSVAFCLLWKAVDRLLESKKIMALLALKHDRKVANAYVVTGPQYSFLNDDVLYGYLATIWKHSSFQMHLICQANNIRYYHFLQPNQYVEASKPMGEEERVIAINDNHIYRLGVIKGYPFLRQYGAELVRVGVKFHDLTMIFAEIEDVLYNDDCCHVNAEGYRIIVSTIGDLITEDMLSR